MKCAKAMHKLQCTEQVSMPALGVACALRCKSYLAGSCLATIYEEKFFPVFSLSFLLLAELLSPWGCGLSECSLCPAF